MVNGYMNRRGAYHLIAAAVVSLFISAGYAQFCQASDGIDNVAEQAAEWVAQGRSDYRRNRYDEAMEAYRKAVSLKPDYADAYLEMGNTLYKEGKYEEAEIAYARAARLSSGRPLLGSSLLYDKDWPPSQPAKETQMSNARPHQAKRRPPRVNAKDDSSTSDTAMQRSLRFRNNPFQRGTRMLMQNRNRE